MTFLAGELLQVANDIEKNVILAGYDDVLLKDYVRRLRLLVNCNLVPKTEVWDYECLT